MQCTRSTLVLYLTSSVVRNYIRIYVRCIHFEYMYVYGVILCCNIQVYKVKEMYTKNGPTITAQQCARE